MSATETFAKIDPEKRARILEASLQEFAEYGYAQASINRVVQRCAIAKGSIFQYFSSKEGLFAYV
ncbi:MAG: TetR/AcrR family transcriptional regulator, partial [Desulfovibrio sp.]|nr:TetR/AcrR family transcriptional regulator [Desulfovibrio sp.]